MKNWTDGESRLGSSPCVYVGRGAWSQRGRQVADLEILSRYAVSHCCQTLPTSPQTVPIASNSSKINPASELGLARALLPRLLGDVVQPGVALGGGHGVIDQEDLVAVLCSDGGPEGHAIRRRIQLLLGDLKALR